MDAEDMRRHLAGADRDDAARPGGAGAETPMAALSGVSIEVGRLGTRLEQVVERLAELDGRLEKAEGQAAAIVELRTQLSAIGEALTADQENGEDGEATPPPRPWDWAAMDRAETWQALEVLGIWARDELFPSWPRLQRRIPECWIYHPEMRRDVSWIYTAYQQAYRDANRRPHHETDFRRVLVDAAASIDQAAKARQCRSQEGTHDMSTPAAGRDDAARPRRALLYTLGMELAARERLLGGAHDQQAREQIAQMRERYTITDGEYHQAMVGAVVQLNQVVTDERRSDQQRQEAQAALEVLGQRHGITEEEYRQMWAQMS